MAKQSETPPANPLASSSTEQGPSAGTAGSGAGPHADNPPQKHGGKTYKVIKGHVGPWTLNSVFDEAEFRRLHAVPDSAAAKAQINADTYHRDLLGRLLALKVIAEAPGEATTPTPVGPGSVPPEQKTNAPIHDAVRQVLAEQQHQAAQIPAGATVVSAKTAQPATQSGTQPAKRESPPAA